MNNVDIIETSVNQQSNAISFQDQPLHISVERALQNFFAQLGDHPITNLYDMVISEVEAPLIKKALEYTHGNQSKAAILLGISRGTLRKKLAQYGL
jgi:Fis family transcriptional regulator, factor for inversion stimulation protein